jgi:lysosomal alpha-mannosidase
MSMGGDFQYQNAHEYFKNLDKLIKYVNDQVRFRVNSIDILCEINVI